MADSTTSPESTEPNSQLPEPDNPNSQANQPGPSPSPSPPPSSSSSTPHTSLPSNPNPNPTAPPPPPPIISPPQPPSIQPYPPPQISTVHPTAPSFRPAAPPVPVPSAPQFSPLPNPNLQAPNFQSHVVQPPGVSPVPVMMPPAVSGAGSVTVSSMPPLMMPPYAPPVQPPNPALRPYAPMPNGYLTMPAPAPQVTMPHPGIPRYPSLYTSMVRPAFPPRPPGAVGIIPVLSRPPIPGIRGPIIPPIVRPAVIPSVTPTEKPQTTVYVGKIASTVENDFMLSLLQLCGSVKSWKRAQDPTNGTLKGFGFCEFDSAEGVLRALRLLSKLNIDGQELMFNVNQATREYLERYVEKKTENLKNLKATETEGAEKEEGSASGAEKNEPPKPSVEDSKKDDNDPADKDNHDIANFGLVTDEDKEADQEALEKLTGMTEERLKTKPLPPPPPPPPPQTAADGAGNSNSDLLVRSRDGDSDVDIMRNDAVEDRNDDEMTSESKPPSEHDRPETSSPDRNRRHDRSRDRERDLKREKERELERYEREREQERSKRERDREYKIREDERRYKVRVKEWESREREREHRRKLEKEMEKDREQERKWEIMEQERESDDGYTKKRKYRSSGEDRKRRIREKEEDLADRLKEEEEIAEAKRRADEEQQQQQKQLEKEALRLLSGHATNGSDKVLLPDETNVESKDNAVDQTSDRDSGHENHIGDGIVQNGIGDESGVGSVAASDMRQNNNVPARKLGFGLTGSGKRTAVPSVFNEEEDEDAQKEKKMRPLVPIDYSTEELQAVQPSISGAPSPNLVAAAEFAKRISNVNPKEERTDAEKERSRRTHERSSQRDRDRNDEEINRTRDEGRKETFDRDRDREHGPDKVKTPDNQKLLDAKQLIDMIPKTKDELFSYEINWAIYDKNELHERMRPWISKKITEFLGEEETTLVDYIVSSTREHVKASEMLDRLQSILDDEAEMFVLKMWRMLIFEIKKLETGLALRSKP